jgi:hypothetical protein
MKKMIAVFIALILLLSLLSACGGGEEASASQAPAASQAQPANDPEPEPEAEPEPDVDDGLIAAHEGDQGDMTSHNTYLDEEYGLLLSYPTVFSPTGEMDANGYMVFPSLQDDNKLLYWVTPNTYEETQMEFTDRVSGVDMVTLEGNVVIGKMDSMDQETGEQTLSVNFWVVDIDWIVNVEIQCDTPEYAEIMFRDLLDAAVTIENAGGVDDGLVAAHEGDQGDMTSHNTYLDEEYGLLLSYPTVFSPTGEMDENGFMIFPSLQDDGKLLYWVSPNTYEETPADFIDHVSDEDVQELPGNVVIGKTVSEESLSVHYWLVNTDFIATVEIHCDTSVSAEMMYADLQNAAVTIESTMG